MSPVFFRTIVHTTQTMLEFLYNSCEGVVPSEIENYLRASFEQREEKSKKDGPHLLVLDPPPAHQGSLSFHIAVHVHHSLLPPSSQLHLGALRGCRIRGGGLEGGLTPR